jgi:hypothetical protein
MPGMPPAIVRRSASAISAVVSSSIIPARVSPCRDRRTSGPLKGQFPRLQQGIEAFDRGIGKLLNFCSDARMR